MKPLEIKFSHQYPKLHGQTEARLLSVILTSREKLSGKFVDYDTVYEESLCDHQMTSTLYKNYELPNGLLLIMVFLGNENIPFTTVRRATAKKQNLYERHIGHWFRVVHEQETVEAMQEALPLGGEE